MQISVISDLHVGYARGKDLCTTYTSQDLDENYIKDFEDFVVKEKIESDYLIICGDISNRAKSEEFLVGSKAIEQIRIILNVKKENVIIIPGNHDVDWEIIKNACSEEDKKQCVSKRYDSYNLYFSEKLTVKPFYDIWEFDDLIIVGFNSSWHDTCDNKVHHGYIENETIKQIEKDISIYKNNKKIKIFILHHHPFQYSDPLPSDFDYSILINSESLLKILANNQFDIVIHGHKHIPRVFTQEINSIHPIAFICAGSFSAILSQKLNGIILNTFHQLEIKGKDDQIAYGIVKNYSYASAHKWFESKKFSCGVQHENGFGAYSSRKEIKSRAIPAIKKYINEKGSSLWSEICNENIYFTYLVPEFVDLVTNEIAEECSLKKIITDDDILFIM